MTMIEAIRSAMDTSIALRIASIIVMRDMA